MADSLTSRPALRPLARRDFRLLLAGSAVVGVLFPLHLMTQVFWVSQHFPDSAVIYSSILAASRGSGMVAFSLLGGAIADRADRKRVLLACESLSFVAHAGIAVLMLTEPLGEGSVGLVAVVTFLAAGIQSIDTPARSASVPAAAGRENIAAAIALLAISSQVTMPLSLPIAGIMNQLFPPGAVYATSLIAWFAIIPLIAMLRLDNQPPPAARGSTLRSIAAGLAYTRAHRPILAIVSLVFVVQVIGMPIAAPLGPMFFIEVLGFNSAQVGLMGATWGLGSVSASIMIARNAHLALRGGSLAFVAIFFGLAVLSFGYSRFIPLTALSDYGLGFAFTSTSLVASTLIQHLVADEMRGRVLSFFPLTIGIAQAATAIAGLAGQAIGLALLLPLLGWLVLTGSLLVVVRYREFLGSRVESRVARPQAEQVS
ncbi:MAG: MFS transporter [Chloroflexi bacterium]|nr:MFS transporter [Dehalococcoidia bacterium]MCO5202537.1 MFS transporter [Chloroflexota bacterium]